MLSTISVIATVKPRLRPPRSYGHLVITDTFFGRLAKTALNFLVKNPR